MKQSPLTNINGFALFLEMGNATMESPDHVADAIRSIASRIMAGEQSGRIRDINGNTVGQWGFR